MRFYALLFTLLLAFSLPAKKSAVYVKFSQFMNSEKETYLELYFSIRTASLDFALSPEGKYYGGIEATVQLFKDSAFVTGDKFRILSPLYGDTNQLDNNLLHQHRFVVPPGNYTIKLSMQDVNEADERHNYEQEITLQLDPNKVQSSDIQFLESYTPAKKGSRNARSGYDLVPIITAGSQYFPETENKLAFYLELYNLDVQLGKEADYLLKYYLSNSEDEQPLSKFASFTRKKAKTIEPVLASFNIENLPTGNYNLMVEVLNKKGELILQNKAFFFRKNNMAEVVAGSFENLNINGSFADGLGNLDSLYRFITYLHPISSEREQNLQEGLLAEGDEATMRRYFFAFWQEKNALNPATAWNDYHDKVRITNRLYTSGMRKGFKSDRGRVYLTYGAPDQIDKRQMEPNMPPYEIWHYKRINSPFAIPQTNRIFIFGEFEASTREYQLFHSTALGELQSRDWRQDLYYRAYGGSRGIDPNGLPNSGDREFGSRANQNMILQSTGAERSNR
jgi:GWxTD domain-containing protein